MKQYWTIGTTGREVDRGDTMWLCFEDLEKICYDFLYI